MKATYAVPQTNRTQRAFELVDAYFEPMPIGVITVFMESRSYRQFAFYMNFAGITGWPVPAVWDELKQTMRDMQS